MNPPSIPRRLLEEALYLLDSTPALALLGPRQVGKTTLALALPQSRDAIYLDLESPNDRNKLLDVEYFCQRHQDKLIILDEVQRVPELFAPLRSVIDRGIQRGRTAGQFVLLGSASVGLLQQSSESLAGRISYLELCPVDTLEAAQRNIDRDTLWLRGGFPRSLLAPDDALSLRWRRDFIQTYLERDIPQLGPRIPAETLRRFWTMLAHCHGQTFNAASIARGLDVAGVTVSRYLDLLVDLLLVRRLPAWHGNAGKRLVKSPKVWIRDSGICHALLGITDTDTLLGHTVCGHSWEGFVVEQLLNRCNPFALASHYRSSGGNEIDLILELPGGQCWAIEIKRSSAPAVGKGFHMACDDIKPTRKIVVHGGSDDYMLRNDVEALSLQTVMTELAGI